MALFCLCVPISAYADFEIGFVYNNFIYHVIDEQAKTVTLSQIVDTNEVGETLTIPETVYDETDQPYKVTAIGLMNGLNYRYGPQFDECEKLKTINVPNSVVELGYWAFAQASNLISINLPNTLTKIRSYSFRDCTGLKSLEIPNSITEIERWAFEGCTGLTTVKFPNSLTTLYDNVFLGCTGLTTVEFPESLTTINTGAFYGCTGLTTVEFPESLTTINTGAFGGCTGLTTLKFPNSLKSIGSDAFEGCTKLSEAQLPDSLEFLGAQAFHGCAITDVVLPSTLETIDTSFHVPFEECPIESITIYCKNVPNWMFSRIETLQKLKIGDGVSSIGTSAFNGCTNLKEVEIGNANLSIGQYTFKDCGIETLSINCPEIGASWFNGFSSLKSVTFGDHVENIGTYAFYGCSIDSITFPGSLKSIGSYAFGYNKLSSLYLPKTITSVHQAAFLGCPLSELHIDTNSDLKDVFTCSDLTDVSFGDEVTTIPSFNGATKLTHVKLPATLKVIPDNAFSNCSSLYELQLPSTVTAIRNNAFSRCYSLEGLKLPENLIQIGSYAFADCYAINGLAIPSSVNYIGEYAFSNCIKVSVFKLPDSVTTISAGLFSGCTNLEKVYFSEKVNSIGSHAFSNCSKLRSIKIPDGVKELPSYMMQWCTSLYEILIPNSVTKIGEYAFSECSSLINVDLGTGVYEIADKAFENCSNIKDIHSMALNPPFAEMYSFPVEAYNSATVTVKEQSLTKYNQQNPWYRFSNYLTVSGAISLSHYQVDMAGNEVFQLGVYGADSEITWTSSNPSVAYANKCGLIVALGITGSTTITAHVNDEEINCRVTVSAVQRPAKSRAAVNQDDDEDLEPVDIIIESIEGNPPMINARLIPVGASTVIDWTCSNEDIATVENGIITIKGEGDVEFGAETDNGLSETLEADTEDLNLSGVEPIITDKLNVKMDTNVYDLTGRCIINNATEDQLYQLKKGIYIFKGKKIAIK